MPLPSELCLGHGFADDCLPQFGDDEQGIAGFKQALHHCHKQKSLTYTILAAGLQEAYGNLRPPIDGISYLRPTIGVLFLVIAARFFTAAVGRRKPAVFGMVLLAALLATGANILGLKVYFESSYDPSCEKEMEQLAVDRTAELALKEFARAVDSNISKPSHHAFWNLSVRAEGRTLIFNHRANWPILDMNRFHTLVSERQKQALERYCSEKGGQFLRSIKAIETHRYQFSRRAADKLFNKSGRLSAVVAPREQESAGAYLVRMPWLKPVLEGRFKFPLQGVNRT